jgi:hypothetical protein
VRALTILTAETWITLSTAGYEAVDFYTECNYTQKQQKGFWFQANTTICCILFLS